MKGKGKHVRLPCTPSYVHSHHPQLKALSGKVGRKTLAALLAASVLNRQAQYTYIFYQAVAENFAILPVLSIVWAVLLVTRPHTLFF